MFSNLLQAFVSQVKSRPDATALVVCRDEHAIPLTWSRLAAVIVAVAQRLEGPRVGFASDNSLADAILPLACMAGGVIEVPFDHRLGESIHELWKQVGGQWLGPADRQQLMDHALLVRDTLDDLMQLEGASQGINPDDPSLILWTSATTASPKGVALSHRNLAANAHAKLNAVPQSPEDVRLTVLPLCHSYARTCDFGTWLLSGCRLAVGLGLEAWKSLGPAVRPTLANTVPSLAQRLLTAKPDDLGLDRLRLLGCGGAAMSDADFEAWRSRGVTVIQGYGLTETSPVICSATPENATAGLVGGLVEGWEHEIRDGRLHVRGPHLMLGYWNDEAATARRIDDEGWFDTGDVVQVDAMTGQFRILGRSDDVIVLDDGHKVHPQAIERDIRGVEGIRHAMVVPSGRHVDAWIDADQSIGLEDLRGRISQALASRPSWERPAALFRFDPPLSQEAGELTHKGAVRRQRIIETRGRWLHSQ